MVVVPAKSIGSSPTGSDSKEKISLNMTRFLVGFKLKGWLEMSTSESG